MPKKFCWCTWAAEHRVKLAHTRDLRTSIGASGIVRYLKLKNTLFLSLNPSFLLKLTRFVFLSLARMYQPTFELLCKEREQQNICSLLVMHLHIFCHHQVSEGRREGYN